MATLDEEKEEILLLLQAAYPNHTKHEIMISIFPFVQKLLKLQWYITVEMDEFVAFTSFNGENQQNDLILLENANKTTTCIRKDKVKHHLFILKPPFFRVIFLCFLLRCVVWCHIFLLIHLFIYVYICIILLLFIMLL